MNAIHEWFQRKLRRGEIGVGAAKATLAAPAVLFSVLVGTRLIIGVMVWCFPWPECREAVQHFTWASDGCVIISCFFLGVLGLRRKGVFGGLQSVDEQWLATTPFAEKYIFRGPLIPHLHWDLPLIALTEAAIHTTGAASPGLAILAYLAGMHCNCCRILVYSYDRWTWFCVSFCLTTLPTAVIVLGILPSACLLGVCLALISPSVRKVFSLGVSGSWMLIAELPHKELEVWPYSDLHESGKKQRPSPVFGWMIAVLGATAAFSAVLLLESQQPAHALHAPREDHDSPAIFAWGVWVIIGLVLTLWRLMVYFHRHRSPLTILGRIYLGQWIIPRYDIALGIPVAMLLVVALTVCASYSIPGLIALPVSVFTACILLHYGPPDWQTWRLTAPVRMVEPFVTTNKERTHQRL